MKTSRQAKLTELIKNNNFDRQEELQAKLNECGFKVTQATVSRDIRELGIIKSEGDDGIYKYRLKEDKEINLVDNKFYSILKQTVASVAGANNLIVVKTYAGMGSAAGAAFDSLHEDGVIGTLAGDDTLLIIASDNASAQKVIEKLNEILG